MAIGEELVGQDGGASAGFAGEMVPEGEVSEGRQVPRGSFQDGEGSRIHRWLLTLSASAALHVAALGLALVAAGAGAAPPIFVDLVAELEGEAANEARSGTTSAATPPRARTEGPRLPAARTERVVGARPAVPASAESRPVMTEPTPPPRPELAAETPPKPEPEPPTGSAAPVGRAPDPPASAGPEASTTSLASEGGKPRGDGSAASTDTAPGGSASGSGAGTALAAATRGSAEGRGGIPPEYAPYLQRFRRRLQESLEYPLAARRQGLSGRVELEVLLEPSGRIDAVRVISSSSHAVLDDAALDAVKRLPPEPLPGTLPRRPLRIRLPLGFELE